MYLFRTGTVLLLATRAVGYSPRWAAVIEKLFFFFSFGALGKLASDLYIPNEKKIYASIPVRNFVRRHLNFFHPPLSRHALGIPSPGRIESDRDLRAWD